MKVSNSMDDVHLMECILCGASDRLAMIAYRNDLRIVGYMFACVSCLPKVADKSVELKM